MFRMAERYRAASQAKRLRSVVGSGASSPSPLRLNLVRMQGERPAGEAWFQLGGNGSFRMCPGRSRRKPLSS
jgi:hypothetical protein